MRLRSCILAAAALAVLVAAGSAGAQPGLADSPGLFPQAWSDDVQGGHYNNLSRAVPCTVNTITAKLSMAHVNPDPDGRFGPAVRIILQTTDTSDAPDIQVAALEIVGGRSDQADARLVFTRTAHGQPLDAVDLGSIKLGETADMLLSWNEAGDVTASVNGGEKQVIRLNNAPHMIRLLISGADAGFREVRTGFAGGAPPADCAAVQEETRPGGGLRLRDWSANVAGGHVRHVSIPVTCSRRVSLVLRMDNTNLDDGGKWGSAITMQLGEKAFNAPADFTGESAVLQLLGRHDGTTSPFVLYRAEGGKRDEQQPAGSADFHQDVPISLAWNEKNEVSAKVGDGDPVTIAMAHAPASLDLSVSGAIATFRDVLAEFPPGKSREDCMKIWAAAPGGLPPQ